MPGLAETVSLDGGRVATYELIGRGPPLQFFMGGPGFSAAVLRAQAELLADDFSVYLIDPHGSGGSTPPSDPSQYDHLGHARFYEEVNRALGIGPATIMGESFGGIVALTFAALFPRAATNCICVAARVLGEELAGDEAAAETHPGRNRSGRKQIQASRGSNEDLFVILGNNIVAGVEVLIQIEDSWHLSRDGKDRGTEDAASVVDFEGQSVAKAQLRIIRGGAWDALIADEGTTNDSGQIVFLRRGLSHEGANCHQSPDGEVF